MASGGYDTVDRIPWSRNAWVCLSDGDTSTGSCPSKALDWDVYHNAEGKLSLTFTEQRSHHFVVLTLKNINRGKYYGTSCAAIAGYYYPMYAAGYNWCIDGNASRAARTLSVYLPQTELAKLPTGGVWKAKLVLNEMMWDPYVKVATFSADITLNVTDKNNGAIYLPAFGSATPRVDLNLRTHPLSTAPGGEVSGQSNIDMCLYDGYNSNSPWLKVTLADQQSVAGRAADVFSVSRDGSSATAAADRIDYRVTLNYNNQPQKVNNGQAITLTGVNTALIRPVVLPGIPFPVVCTPAPLTLDVLPFAKLSKAAGHFTGTLRVTLSADALAP
ncbi:CfaE/CblD family pilus tip adhesin [Serratia liquefaciens]|uniref:CfaE/CblD family pilus tip adhesin n=1 Tax=Serratia liquefaciens TaxID=614 RepID=UPI002FD260AB